MAPSHSNLGGAQALKELSSSALHFWSRRRLLQSISGVVASTAFPAGAPAAPASPFSQFTDVAQSAGLISTMPYGEGIKATYITEIMGGGCAFFDYDNDGWLDIFILGGRRLEGIPPGASNRLYRNNRDGTFTDVTKVSGLMDAGWAVGVCVGDYNNDGFEDLYVTYYGQNRLYRNNGNGTFTDVTKESGLGSAATRFGSGCTFVDYNRDGHLDLFVANYADVTVATLPTPSLERPNCNFEGVPVNCGPSGLAFPTNLLYRNNGDGTFTDVSKESGVAAMRGSYGLTAAAFDVDEDGWPDILVACDSTPSLLLMNNHDGTFREEALLRGIALSSDGKDMAGMGLGIGDYDCDGHLDVVRTHYMNQATGLYHNNGKGEFEDATSQAGIIHERRFVSWGAGLVDLDNDGYLDIVIMNQNEIPSLLRNDAPSANHWIKIRVIGTKSNRNAFGSRVTVRYGDKVQVQEAMSQSSYVSSNDSRLHFGLGSAESVDIEIRWPLGLVELHKSVQVNRLITFKEGTGTIDSQPLVPASPLSHR